MLDSLMVGLIPRSREVLHLRFKQALTQAETGQLLGVSQTQVSRLVRQGLQKMRDTVR